MFSPEQTNEIVGLFLEDAERSRRVEGQKGYSFNMLASTGVVIVWEYDTLRQASTFDWLMDLAHVTESDATSMEVAQVALAIDTRVRAQQRELIRG